MFRNYVVSALRNMRRHMGFALINTLGLGAGLAVCLVILEYVQHEKSFDRFHTRHERMIWVHALSNWGGDSLPATMMSPATATLARQYLPGIEATLRLTNEYPTARVSPLGQPSVHFRTENFVYADSNFFRFFSFRLLRGDPNRVLDHPFSIVISQAMAAKFFGSADPLGQQLQLNGKDTFTVTGITEDAPATSTIRYDCIAALSSFGYMEDKKGQLDDPAIRAGSFYTYAITARVREPAALESAFTRLQQRADPGHPPADRVLITPLDQVHLWDADAGQANTRYLSLFQGIAALILLLALTNYVSLSTARASVRAKEIGMRKVMGADRAMIAGQFFGESVLYTALAFATGLMTYLVIRQPVFAYLALSIDQNFWYTSVMLQPMLALFAITVLLAGGYPSLVLSGFNPLKVLNGQTNAPGAHGRVRTIMTLFQFSLSIVLIICSIVISRQVHFIRHTDTGMNRDQVLMIPFPQDMGIRFPAFRAQVAALSGVSGVATDHYQPYTGADVWNAHTLRHPDPAALSVFNVDEQFIPLLQLRWSVPPDDSLYARKTHQVILNEAAVASLHLQPGVLHQTVMFGDDLRGELAGILKDFNFETLEKKITPMGLFVASDTAPIWSRANGVLLAKLAPNVSLPPLIARVKTVYEQYEQEEPFRYDFLDDAFAGLYRREERLSQIFLVFMGVTLGIAALGLLGLVTFMTGRRNREISIRKALGASVNGIARLLVSEFARLVLLAWIIACPLAWWAMRQWLDHFAYRIDVKAWMLAAGGLGALVLALVTVGWQAIRAASVNPVPALRSS